MQLSILIATHRAGLSACSKLAQACAWAGPNVEVIIRDNSGDAEKAVLLPQFKRDNCTIIIADPCDSHTNIGEILKLARGEFIFILADDDYCFDHAIASIPGVLNQIADDHSVVGLTGVYAVESSQGSALVEYKGIDSDDPATRVNGYLNHAGANVMLYAPLRRELVQRIYGFHIGQPALFSFHDQTISLLYLLNGKFARLKRLLYLYDVGPWEKSESAQERDVSYYHDAGLDSAINKLHWFLCAFEGAALARNADLFPDYPLPQRQVIADRWFATMFHRFKNNPRLTFNARFAAEAERLCAQLLKSTGQMSFQEMLNVISAFMALSSEDKAQHYFRFWNALIDRRKPVPVLPLVASG